MPGRGRLSERRARAQRQGGAWPIPPQHADLFINISSFQEMRPDQVANFLVQVGRHTDGIFYMKQWRAWTNKADGVTIRQEDYLIPGSWDRVYEREHPVQSDFFEAAYRIENPAPGPA